MIPTLERGAFLPTVERDYLGYNGSLEKSVSELGSRDFLDGPVVILCLPV